MIEVKHSERSYKTGVTEAWVLRRIETLCPRPQRNLFSMAVFILAACLPVALCFAASTTGEVEKAAKAPAPLAPGAYLGLKLPGEAPEIFAPGIVSIPGRNTGHLAFSPDGLECYFTVFDFDEKKGYNNSRMLFTRYRNGAWTPQVPVTFAGGRENMEPLFSRDGNRLYFGVRSSPTDTDFWTVHRASRNEEWSDPQPLGVPFNSPKEEWNLAQTADGTMYFASNRDGGHGGLDIYRTASKPGQSLQVENLGAPVNSEFDDGDPGISPDGKTLVFYSVPNRPGVTGRSSDLFICFDNGHGGWTEPVNMGEGFSTPGDEFAATFSQDGRVLFFARFDGKHGDVYWVSTAALERFRKLSH
jgi:Tol biopolymer transport system component